MPEPSPTDFLSDPLSDVARKERRNLLIASITGILIATAGLVPKHISALGIEFSPLAQNAFVILAALVVVYFVFAFAIYGISDFFIWRKKYQDYLVAVEAEMQGWTEEDQHYHDELHHYVPRIDWLYNWSKPAAFARIIFEFVLPVIVGIVSICWLLLKVWRP